MSYGENNLLMRNKKITYYVAIILSFILIYSLATATYFLCMYRSVTFNIDVDIFFDSYFYLFNIPGILAVSFFFKGHYSQSRMLIAYTVSLLSIILVAFLLFLPISNTVFMAVLIIEFLLFGCTQGCYIFLMTIFCPKENRSLLFGIAAAIAVVINSLLPYIHGEAFVQSKLALIIYLFFGILGCCLLAFIFNKISITEIFDNESPAADARTPQQWKGKAFFIACLFIAFSWAIQSLGFFFPYNSSKILGISNETLRTTNVFGLLLGGYITNRNKRLSAITCLIILATPMLYIILQAEAGITLLVFMLSYFFTGVLSVYRFGITSDMSDSVDSKGSPMTFLCTFGLIFGRLGEGIGGFIGITLSQNQLLLLSVTCFALVIATAFFIFHYITSFIPVPQVVQNHEDKMASFKAKYDISTRETDVLELLIEGKSNAEIADRLFVSENTVRFHVSNILKKTGCKSRKDVSSLFYLPSSKEI